MTINQGYLIIVFPYTRIGIYLNLILSIYKVYICQTLFNFVVILYLTRVKHLKTTRMYSKIN